MGETSQNSGKESGQRLEQDERQKDIMRKGCAKTALWTVPVFCLWSLALAAHAFAADDGVVKLTGHGGPIKAISISTDGKRALTASFDYSIVHWELSDSEGKIIHRMIGHGSAVNDVAFVPDQQKAVSVSDDGSLGVWDLETGKLIKRIRGEPFKALDVAVSSDGRLAAAARWDGTVRLFDLTTLSETFVLEGHKGNVNAVAFSSDGSLVYSAAYDGQVLEWETATGRFVRPVYRHGWGINSISILDDDRLAFGAINGAFGIVSISRAELSSELTKRERPIQTVKVSQNGRLVGYGDGEGRIEIFDVASLTAIEAATVTYGPVWDFDFLPGQAKVFHVGLDDFATRWQIAPRKLSKIESKFPRRFQRVNSSDPGELEFLRKCSVCHTLTPDDGNRAGPTLHAVFGRKAGSLPDYIYSKALLDSDIVWNEETIGLLFEKGPDIVTPGTKMPIQRLKSVTRRDDLIRYLKEATTPKN